MQDPMYPAGCSDADSYFDDDSEPLLDDDCDFAIVPEYCDHGVEIEDCMAHGASALDNASIDTELHGETHPRDAVEAVGYEYEFAHGAILSL